MSLFRTLERRIAVVFGGLLVFVMLLMLLFVRHRGHQSQPQFEVRYRNLYPCSMKTTLDINDSLLANAKALAARQRTSLTRLIEEGLQLRLRTSESAGRRSKRKLPVFKGGGGMVAGVNPASNKSMLDAADDDA